MSKQNNCLAIIEADKKQLPSDWRMHPENIEISCKKLITEILKSIDINPPDHYYWLEINESTRKACVWLNPVVYPAFSQQQDIQHTKNAYRSCFLAIDGREIFIGSDNCYPNSYMIMCGTKQPNSNEALFSSWNYPYSEDGNYLFSILLKFVQELQG